MTIDGATTTDGRACDALTRVGRAEPRVVGCSQELEARPPALPTSTLHHNQLVLADGSYALGGRVRHDVVRVRVGDREVPVRDGGLWLARFARTPPAVTLSGLAQDGTVLQRGEISAVSDQYEGRPDPGPGTPVIPCRVSAATPLTTLTGCTEGQLSDVVPAAAGTAAAS